MKGKERLRNCEKRNKRIVLIFRKTIFIIT